MDIRELRIGNNVHFDGYDDCIVEGIGLDTVIINTYDVIEEVFVSQLKPINLTEDWLIHRFGFEKVIIETEVFYDVSYHLKVSDDMYIVYSEDMSCGLYYSEDYVDDIPAALPKWEKIRYVHGLQNLLALL